LNEIGKKFENRKKKNFPKKITIKKKNESNIENVFFGEFVRKSLISLINEAKIGQYNERDKVGDERLRYSCGRFFFFLIFFEKKAKNNN